MILFLFWISNESYCPLQCRSSGSRRKRIQNYIAAKVDINLWKELNMEAIIGKDDELKVNITTTKVDVDKTEGKNRKKACVHLAGARSLYSEKESVHTYKSVVATNMDQDH